MHIIEKLHSEASLVNTIEQTPVGSKEVLIWYLGQCGFIFKTNDLTIGIDLVLSELYDSEGKPRRLYSPPMTATQTPKLTHIFCTHNHADHLNISTVQGILQTHQQTKCVIPAGIASDIHHIPSERVIYAVQNQKIELANSVSVLPIQVAHETYDYDDNKQSKNLGFLFLFYNLKVFHSGDAISDQLLKQTIKKYKPFDAMMLPINGTDSYRKKLGIIGNMNHHDAVKLATLGETKLAIPMHFDLFRINGANPNDFVDSAVKQNSSFDIWIPKLGNMISLPTNNPQK